MSTTEQLTLLPETAGRRTGKELGLSKKGGTGAEALLKALVRQGVAEDALETATTIVLLLDEMACNGGQRR